VSDKEDYGHRFTALPSRTPTPARLTSAVALTWRPLLQVAAPRPCACPSEGTLRAADRQLGRHGRVPQNAVRGEAQGTQEFSGQR
jgi:hypothetical protein